jgi:hypothetical protein
VWDSGQGTGPGAVQGHASVRVFRFSDAPEMRDLWPACVAGSPGQPRRLASVAARIARQNRKTLMPR